MEISVIYNFLREDYPDKATYSLARKCKRELDKAGETSIAFGAQSATPQARMIIAAVVNHN